MYQWCIKLTFNVYPLGYSLGLSTYSFYTCHDDSSTPLHQTILLELIILLILFFFDEYYIYIYINELIQYTLAYKILILKGFARIYVFISTWIFHVSFTWTSEHSRTGTSTATKARFSCDARERVLTFSNTIHSYQTIQLTRSYHHITEWITATKGYL